MTARKRLDQLLIDNGLADSLSKAQALILAGEVVVDEQRVDKPGTQVKADSTIRLKNEPSPYVSRGGVKLKAALEHWPIQLKDTVCIDVGSSTGGFTNVLLNEGARKVYCVDVGYNQLAYSLRMDPRVVVMERTHILNLDPEAMDEIPSIAVVDLSFISLKKVLQKIADVIDTPGIIYALIKPQFEISPQFIEKGGIVRDEQARHSCVNSVIEHSKKIGLKNRGLIESPIQGADGNIEYLVALTK